MDPHYKRTHGFFYVYMEKEARQALETEIINIYVTCTTPPNATTRIKNTKEVKDYDDP